MSHNIVSIANTKLLLVIKSNRLVDLQNKIDQNNAEKALNNFRIEQIEKKVSFLEAPSLEELQDDLILLYANKGEAFNRLQTIESQIQELKAQDKKDTIKEFIVWGVVAVLSLGAIGFTMVGDKIPTNHSINNQEQVDY